MRLPPQFEWAYPGGSEVCGIRVVGADRMLCGDLFSPRNARPGWCPTAQPVDPALQCGRCLAKLREMA